MTFQKGNKVNLGRFKSEETRKKISKSKKGQPSPRKGVKLSEETKRKISQNNARIWLGKKRPQETIEKIRIANTGKHPSLETLEKLRQSHLGNVPSEETRRKISEGNKGKKMSEEGRRKLSEARKGFKMSEEQKQKLSQINRGRWTGEKNPMWKGGTTPINAKIRCSEEYELWRKSVFERDKYTCIWCGQMGGEIHADHIKPFSMFPELRFAIDNGRTLCKDCHRKTDTFLGKIKTYKKDLGL